MPTVYGRIKVVGTAGNDYVFSDITDDTLIGDVSMDGGNGSIVYRGHDSMNGGSGNDTMYGDGEDHLNPFGGNDLMYGGTGNDTMYGCGGNDWMFGDVGFDVLYGDDGDDWIWGGAWHDTLYGGAGNDTLVGGVGNDVLWGDLIDVYSGSTSQTGTDSSTSVQTGGADVFEYRNGEGNDIIMDYHFDEGDIVRFYNTDYEAYSSGGDLLLKCQRGPIKGSVTLKDVIKENTEGMYADVKIRDRYGAIHDVHFYKKYETEVNPGAEKKKMSDMTPDWYTGDYIITSNTLTLTKPTGESASYALSAMQSYDLPRVDTISGSAQNVTSTATPSAKSK